MALLPFKRLIEGRTVFGVVWTRQNGSLFIPLGLVGTFRRSLR